MSLLSKSIIKTPEEYEVNREALLNAFNTGMDELDTYAKNAELASEIEDDFLELDCLSKLENLDSITFIQIDVNPNQKILFGDISKAIEDAINIEVDEIMNINEHNASRQATTDIIKESFNIKRKKIIDEVIFGTNTESYEQNMMTVRCMEIYSEMSQTVESISERSRKKNLENEKLLLFIGITPKVNKNLAEANLNEVVSYTVAIASNVKDGTIPDVNAYKTKVVEAINNGINSVANSKNVTATIKSFKEVSEILNDCKKQLEHIPNSKNFVNTITAIEDVCIKEASQIKELYNDLEL